MENMDRYIGTKVLLATPMTRGEYNTYRGWTLPANENGADEGYLVEYPDGGESNHPDHKNYVSWSPRTVFEKSYQPAAGLSFGMALDAMKLGKRVARTNWNGTGMWLALVLGYDYNPDAGKGAVHALGCKKLPWIGIKTADSTFVPWTASQTDMLATDWITF